MGAFATLLSRLPGPPQLYFYDRIICPQSPRNTFSCPQTVLRHHSQQARLLARLVRTKRSRRTTPGSRNDNTPIMALPWAGSSSQRFVLVTGSNRCAHPPFSKLHAALLSPLYSPRSTQLIPSQWPGLLHLRAPYRRISLHPLPRPSLPPRLTMRNPLEGQVRCHDPSF